MSIDIADEKLTKAPTDPDAARRLSELTASLEDFLGSETVVSDYQRRRTYECDGLMHYRSVPALVVFPKTALQVQGIVKRCRDAGIAFVARGSGTGLSAGALPQSDGVLIVLTKMRKIVQIDLDSARVVVEPGVINAQVTRAIAPQGYYYAPDPSSQSVCSIGGNVAENSGGAHCLKYGFTTNHITGLEIVTPEGDLVEIGGGMTLDAPGYDLLGAFVGSEGTIGIATSVTMRVLRIPEAVETLLVGYPDIDTAGEAVSEIIASGLLPAAIEMMDELAIEAAEAAVHCDYPKQARAVLLVEVDGPSVEVSTTAALVESICRKAGATEVRRATDPETRMKLWKGRKSAFAAVGRISPNFLIQDGVIPRTSLSQALHEIAERAAAKGIRVANVFHAGDGNLHPLVLFDASVSGEQQRAEELSGEIIDLCIGFGGSITGEHGVGIDKIAYMAKMFDEATLSTMRDLRSAFDPRALCNPGKAIPEPSMCGEATWRSKLGRDKSSVVSPLGA